jgi:hypothetical protein
MSELDQSFKIEVLGDAEPITPTKEVQVERKKKENAILDVESGIRIGLPPWRVSESGQVINDIPNDPYTFMVKDLTVERKKDGKKFELKDVNILLCHGWNPNGKWKFLNGDGVVSSVKRFNEGHPDKKIELITSCNDKNDQSEEIKVGVSELSNVAHVVGSTVNTAYGYILPTADIHMSVTIPKDGNDWGLEELEVGKQVKIL